MKEKYNNIVLKIKSISPNYIIVILSAILSVLFLFLSYRSVSGSIVSNYFISLSASVTAVGVAVILVDCLRNYHLKKQYEIPKKTAIIRIRDVHSKILLTILISCYKKDKQFLIDFVNSGTNNSLASVLTRYSKKAQLLAPEVMFANMSNLEISEGLRNDVKDLLTRIDSVVHKYEYSFLDADFKYKLAGLVTSLETIYDSFVLFKFTPREVAKLLLPEPDEKDAYKVIIGSMIIGYIKDLNKFVDDYANEDYGSQS